MKKNIFKYGIEALVLIAIIIVFVIINKSIDDSKSKKCSVYDNDGLNIYIETCEIDGSSIELNGWCFRQGVDTEANGATNIPIQVILMDKANNENKIFMNSNITYREDINDIYKDGGNYKYGGFNATKSTSMLKFDRTNYDILFYYPYWSPHGSEDLFGYKSGYSIINGKLERE